SGRAPRPGPSARRPARARWRPPPATTSRATGRTTSAASSPPRRDGPRPARTCRARWRPAPAPRARPVARRRAASRGPASSSPGLPFLPAPLAARAGLLHAEIELLDVLRGAQPLAAVLQDDAAVLEHIAVVGGVQGHARVLLHQQDGGAALAVD